MLTFVNLSNKGNDQESVRSYEPPLEKTCLWGFRPSLTQTRPPATEDGWRLEISDLENIGIVLYIRSENTGADQLRDHCAADLCLCFCTS